MPGDDGRSEWWTSVPRKRVAGGAVIVDDDGRVLLVKPTYKPGWEIPGGLAEAGESPRAATSRELVEELGIDVELGRLLVCDWVPPGFRPDDGVMFLYDAESIDETQIRLAEDELSEWRWCDADEIRGLLHDFKARRVTAAIRARLDGVTVELENGYAVGGSTTGSN